MTVGAGVLLAVPALAGANANPYGQNLGMYPEGGRLDPTVHAYDYNEMWVPAQSFKYHLLVAYTGGQTNDHKYFTTSYSLLNATYNNNNSQPGCYRTSTAAGGGTGYSSPIDCTASYF
jgi:hypothetical protein